MNGYLRGFVCHGGTRPRGGGTVSTVRRKNEFTVAEIVCMIIIPNRTLSRGRISLCPTETLSRDNP